MSSISLETPLAESLSNSVHSKIVEQGWTQEDDTSLAEYIVLMLANGKTQEQIASELAGELLQDASGTEEFAQWLFEQVASLTGSGSSDAVPAGQSSTDANNSAQHDQDDNSMIPAAYDTDMGDSAPGNAPRGPRGAQSTRGSRGGRGGANNKTDSVLHRTRGNDRINSHVRGAPRGPKNIQNQSVRPGMQKALNGLGTSPAAQNPMMQNAQPGMMPMIPQEFMAMMEQQARLMAQFIPSMNQGMVGNNNFSPNGGQQNGRSLFDRIEPGRGGRGGRGRGRGGIAQNGSMRKAGEDMASDGASQADSSQMDAEATGEAQSMSNEPFNIMCHYNLRCINPNCLYAHQSRAAPPGITVDLNDTCKFGSACKNNKCVGKHPSPATVKAFQAEEMCKYGPLCKNEVCPFKHSNTPLCSFGASCRNKDCKFTHLQIPCRFGKDCTNTRCPYKHEEGQNKTISDYQWTAEGAKQKEADKEHVSDRKFVTDEGAEELIKPDGDNNVEGQQAVTSEVAS